MSDEEKKQASEVVASVIEKYQRRGGSARKSDSPQGTWKRLRSWLSPSTKAKGSAEEIEEAEPIKIELILPNRKKISFWVSLEGMENDALKLQISPPPTNKPELVKAFFTALELSQGIKDKPSQHLQTPQAQTSSVSGSDEAQITLSKPPPLQHATLPQSLPDAPSSSQAAPSSEGPQRQPSSARVDVASQRPQPAAAANDMPRLADSVSLNPSPPVVQQRSQEPQFQQKPSPSQPDPFGLDAGKRDSVSRELSRAVDGQGPARAPLVDSRGVLQVDLPLPPVQMQSSTPPAPQPPSRGKKPSGPSPTLKPLGLRSGTPAGDLPSIPSQMGKDPLSSPSVVPIQQGGQAQPPSTKQEDHSQAKPGEILPTMRSVEISGSIMTDERGFQAPPRPAPPMNKQKPGPLSALPSEDLPIFTEDQTPSYGGLARLKTDGFSRGGAAQRLYIPDEEPTQRDRGLVPAPAFEDDITDGDWGEGPSVDVLTPPPGNIPPESPANKKEPAVIYDPPISEALRDTSSQSAYTLRGSKNRTTASSANSLDEEAIFENGRQGLRSSLMPIVGIDFGTSYSSVAVFRAGLEVIPNELGELKIPSVVSFPNPGEVVIGTEARKRMAGEAQFTITSTKRMLGRMYKDPNVTQLLGGLAFRTFAGTDKFIRFEAHGEIYAVTDIVALILAKLRESACQYLSSEATKAVFTVPVGFGSLQRSALQVAAKKAGFEVVGMLTEPSGAVLAHGFRADKGLVAVYDFGGGTFDFAILKVTGKEYRVLCAGGDPWLGGDDFDLAIANHLADKFWKETGVDLRNRAVEWQALVFACEQAKRILTSKSGAEVRIDDLLFTSHGRQGLRYKVTRKEFLQLTQKHIERSIAIAGQVMGQGQISPDKIDAVVLTGGTSLIPAIRDRVAELFKKKPIMGDPDLAVVRGAALRAADINEQSIAGTSTGGRTLREVSGRTIGAGPKGGTVVTLFERDTPVPAESFVSFHTQRDNQVEMVIGIYEEAKSRVDESRTIGHLRYKGLRPGPAGRSRIDFNFYLSEDGILHVTAIVEGKEYSQSIRLE